MERIKTRLIRVSRRVIHGIFLSGIFLLLTAVTSFALGLLKNPRILNPEFLGPFLSGLILAWTFQFWKDLLDLFLEKILPIKEPSHHQLLRSAVRGMYRIESMKHLLGIITHFLTMKIEVQNVVIFVRKPGEPGFWMGVQRGYEKKFVSYHIDERNPLIIHFKTKKKPLSASTLNRLVAKSKRVKVIAPDSISETMVSIPQILKDFDGEFCIPSFLGEELKNILILGKKKNGKRYSAADLDLITQLAQEAAPAIESARLFDETHQKKNELKLVNEQLAYSKSKLLKALKETEVAHKRLQDTQAQLIHEQKMATLGRLAASVGHEVNNPLTILSMNVSRVILKYRKDPNIKIGDIFEIFHKMEQNIGRIKAVVNTLTGLLKKSEKGKFEPLSLKLILEETLPLVQFQTYLENLSGTEVEFDIPAHLPLIRGDLERLQEVFLNLFINAYHAMMGKRNRRIKVTAHAHPEDQDLVMVYFADNGSGMTEEIQRKIFNYGYTTKPPGKGSGLGLYMCKYIIELHGGNISVKSTPGAGTTFIISLPVHVEGASRNRFIPDALSA